MLMLVRWPGVTVKGEKIIRDTLAWCVAAYYTMLVTEQLSHACVSCSTPPVAYDTTTDWTTASLAREVIVLCVRFGLAAMGMLRSRDCGRARWTTYSIGLLEQVQIHQVCAPVHRSVGGQATSFFCRDPEHGRQVAHTRHQSR